MEAVQEVLEGLAKGRPPNKLAMETDSFMSRVLQILPGFCQDITASKGGKETPLVGREAFKAKLSKALDAKKSGSLDLELLGTLHAYSFLAESDDQSVQIKDSC
eukprot:11178882-Lingulodinium_polyedra.AAC.1